MTWGWLATPESYAAVTAAFAEAFGSILGLFLLPGGRPRRLISVIQAGGRPRRLPRPRARRSRVRIASSMCSRSWRSSANIFGTSIIESFSPKKRRSRPPSVLKSEQTDLLQWRSDNVVVQHLVNDFNSLVRKTEQIGYSRGKILGVSAAAEVPVPSLLCQKT